MSENEIAPPDRSKIFTFHAPGIVQRASHLRICSSDASSALACSAICGHFGGAFLMLMMPYTRQFVRYVKCGFVRTAESGRLLISRHGH